MTNFLVSAELLNSLVTLAAQAPVPYAQSQAIWKALDMLKPYEPPKEEVPE
jgi:hypothetical protein